MYILDTNVLSELRKRNRANPKVLAWFQATAPERMFITPIVIAELELGFHLIERKDRAQAAMLKPWLERIMDVFSGRCIPIDEETAHICAKLHAPDPQPDGDAWIAATALARNMTVVTRNISDFAPMGVRTFDPWTYPLS